MDVDQAGRIGMGHDVLDVADTPGAQLRLRFALPHVEPHDDRPAGNFAASASFVVAQST